MSKLESVNFCYVCFLAFETRKQFIKDNLGDENLNRARKEYEDDVEDETKERVFDMKEADYILKPEDYITDNIKTKTTTNTKAEAKTKIKPKIVSTPELCMNIKNFMKNLEIK